MTDTISTVVTGIGVFIGTNVDDLVVLTVLFLSSRATGKPTPRKIVAGQYIGVGALVATAILAALGLVLVPDPWVGLLGLIPLGLGVYGVVNAFRAREDNEPTAVIASGVFSVAGVTVANGADNIAVYTPMFRMATNGEVLLMAAVFVVMVGVWCVAGAALGSHQRVVAFVERFGHWLVPVVFIVIGAVILIDSHVMARLLERS